MFRVDSAWLYSLSVVLGCDMNAKVLVLSQFFCAKPEGTVFFFADEELLQHRVRGFSSFREIAIQRVVHAGRHHSNDS